MEQMSTVYSESHPKQQRRMPGGAEVVADGVHFRVWAPRCTSVSVVLFTDGYPLNGEEPSEVLELDSESNGWFSGLSTLARCGAVYGYRLDEDPRIYPDPVSRYQPEGPHGLSQVIDPSKYIWKDDDWRGVQLAGQIIYEMHIGTFTTEGTYLAAREQLAELAACGITLIEIMPLADFPGRFGWGYDGVNLFAPTRLYGKPDDLRSFIDHAHRLNIGVILDVVYNHVGPDGNFLNRFAEDYFTDRYKTDWGPAINFDGNNSEPVREFFLSNAEYWVKEFHFDGLRLDATQDIHDASPQHILSEITQRVRQAAGKRSTVLIAENEPQRTELVRSFEDGGHGLDGLWNDDFHHAARVALTGRSEAYYSDYRGTPQEFISAMKYGYLFQGQYYDWQKNRRGTSTRGVPPSAFITFIDNHDQVANSSRGSRTQLLSCPGSYRAMTALLLLGPGTPMLFQGQEFGSASPFFYFADHNDELAKKVQEGRRQFMAQFPSVACPEIQARLPDPADPLTFIRSKLDFSDRQRHAEIYHLHRDLIHLRRSDPTFDVPRAGQVDGAVLGPQAFVLRYFGNDSSGKDDRLLIVNFGPDLHLSPAPEPLLAPAIREPWSAILSTEDPKYGGCGNAALDTDENWRIPGHAAVVLRPANSTTVRLEIVNDRYTCPTNALERGPEQ